MTEKTVIEFARERADKPDQERIRQAVNSVSAYSHLGDIRAVATLAILNGERTYSASYTMTRAERLQLIGLLDELKAALLEHQDQPFIERLPSK